MGRLGISESPLATKAGVTLLRPAINDEGTILTRIPVSGSIKRITAVLDGGSTPSVTFTIRHGTDRSAAGTEVVTGGSVVTSITSGDLITVFNNPEVPVNSHLWVEITAVSGSPDAVNVTVYFD